VATKVKSWAPKQSTDLGDWISSGAVDGKIDAITNSLTPYWING